MEWYHWLIVVCPIIVGGGIGWFLDIKKNFNVPCLYWLLGVWSGMPALVVVGVVL